MSYRVYQVVRETKVTTNILVGCVESLAEKSAVNLWRCAPARIMPPIIGALGYALYTSRTTEHLPHSGNF